LWVKTDILVLAIYFCGLYNAFYWQRYAQASFAEVIPPGEEHGAIAGAPSPITLLALSLYVFLFLVFILWLMLLVPTGVNIECCTRRADARAWLSSSGDRGDEPEWDSVVNWDW